MNQIQYRCHVINGAELHCGGERVMARLREAFYAGMAQAAPQEPQGAGASALMYEFFYARTDRPDQMLADLHLQDALADLCEDSRLLILVAIVAHHDIMLAGPGELAWASASQITEVEKISGRRFLPQPCALRNTVMTNLWERIS